MNLDSLEGFTVEDLIPQWKEVFLKNQKEIVEISSRVWDREIGSELFSGVTPGKCWKNVIVITYFLNQSSTHGAYEIMIAQNSADFHVVIVNQKEKKIYDPSFNKYEDENFCKDEEDKVWKEDCFGTECTLSFLNKIGGFKIVSLEEYLETFSFSISYPETLNNQLREACNRFKGS